MKLNSLSCPNCDASVEIEDGLDIFYCKYCGYKLILEGQSAAAYHAKTKVKGMEHDERMADMDYAQERYRIEQIAKEEKSKNKLDLLFIFGLILFLVSIYAVLKIESDKQEVQLQQLVNEIQKDIENKEFDTAYVKAKQIKYTATWGGNDTEEKWDDTRRAVIDQIIAAEKKATGKSDHKPEKKGWFD